MNIAIEVLTPTMVRTPLGTSWIYTPGYVGDTGIEAPCLLLVID
jgi:hypothetical protein